MKRVAKFDGPFNVGIEEVEVPQVSDTQVLIRAVVSLISRGSEIWRRYVLSGPVDHAMMGYSLAGVVEAVGRRVTGLAPGDRVAALAPHAEYAVVEVVNSKHLSPVVRLPDTVSFEAGTFWPLATSSVLWVREVAARKGDAMVILGQGLVGSGCLQVARADGLARLIAVDALPLRCDLARRLGADEVIDTSVEDPVAAVKRLTGEDGADIVVEAVGGRAGAKAFAQAQDMVRRGGLIQVIGLYENEPLPLDSGKIQGRRVVGGYSRGDLRPEASDRALSLLAERQIRVEDMITHRFPFDRASEAFDLLYNRLGETMAVMLVWG